MRITGSYKVKVGLAEMLKGGVIMDVTNREQAEIAQNAGACAVMALERVPADIRRDGGVARMADIGIIKDIQKAVSIPVMAKARIGHFVEAQILEAVGVDFIDESEVLTPADEENHIIKHGFKVPFVCGATNLGEALRRIGEGAAMIRSKGEAGTGNIIEAVRHNHGKLPVPLFAAGGIATPADAALMRQLGAESVFVGSGIFKSDDPKAVAEAIVQATTFFDKPEKLAELSTGLGKAMIGLEIGQIPADQIIQNRGW
jgi:pyridoxal 5'-phosphate synthase pdxS subunit